MTDMTMNDEKILQVARSLKTKCVMPSFPKRNRHCSAQSGSVQTVTIQHFHTLKTQEVDLIKVVEDDCDWRFPDGSELAYEWSVIDTAQNK